VGYPVQRAARRREEPGGRLAAEFLDRDSPFPLPDIDQTVLHRGEAFVVDDVIWDLERKTVTVELVPSDEVEVEPASATAPAADDSDDGFEDFTDGGEEGDDFDEDPQSGEHARVVPAVPAPEATKATPVGEAQAPEGPPPVGSPRVKDAGRGERIRASGPQRKATRRGDAHPE